ncbi:MAG: GNAT family N-acetyltransferase [Putridiphycobacter sp.]
MLAQIETERFILRPLKLSDVDGIFKLDSDPDVHQYLGGNPIKTLDQAKHIIETVQSQYQSHGIGRWAIEDKNTHEFMGWSGLKLEDKVRPNLTYYDLGYRIIKDHWGKGIATETAQAALQFGFETLKVNEIFAAADVANLGSNTVLQKIGMKFIEVFDYEGIPINWYGFSKSDWEI